ncbi:outer membrane beta-barrel domain-containing protein [Bdellovibrio reynosensis]|uniref:Outer membrane beta-barrel domain-containing protein n=1 Tax=Bdellovibrio reynosensis TaxID=2835041 RepID=A0ABY4C895_9BACT|nr:outer membrane beta-barrel domain-containing protein [Bdellovibrio reynosensis]UOE99712.1 outer membrane beta-barrel domain-containing protein [Bdellovibrio reynosensis]
MMNGFKAVVIFVLAMLLQKAAFAAEVVELPPEELAQESVLPVFDRPVSVRNRTIVTNKKFEVDGFYSYAMTEPIANVSKLGIGIYYNTSESHAWGLLVGKHSTGLSSYAEQLDKQFNLDFARAPYPDLTTMLDYNLKAFYGKMSISKSIVFNTLLFGSASAGMVKYIHKSYPAVAVGMGQKFYFTKDWAVRFDLRLYAHQAPVPFLASRMKTTDPTPEYSEFEERLTFTTNLDVGLSYLF